MDSRPRVICHMAASIDGRIVVDGWPASFAAAIRREYEQVHTSYESNGWICGRVTRSRSPAVFVRPRTWLESIMVMRERTSPHQVTTIRSQSHSRKSVSVSVCKR